MSAQQLYKITLIRSPIGLPQKIHKTVKALGLKKTTQSIAYKPVDAVWAGMILRCKEIVKVELVGQEEMFKKQAEKREKKDLAKGWTRLEA